MRDYARKKRYRKRNYRRKRNVKRKEGRALVRTHKSILRGTFDNPIPYNAHVVFRSKIQLKLDLATGGVSSQTWQIEANTCYRPYDIALPTNASFVSGGSTFSPNTFVNYGNLYTVQRVLASTIKLRTVGPFASGSAGLKLAVAPITPGSGAYASFATCAQAMHAKESWSNDYNFGYVKNTLTTAQVFNVRRQQVLDETDFSCTFTTSPVNPWSWQIYYQTMDGNAPAGGTLFGLEVEQYQYCKLEEPNYAGSSD